MDMAIPRAIQREGLTDGMTIGSSGPMPVSFDTTEGHSVALPGLGTMRFGLRSKAVEDVNDVKTGLIESRRIIFTPSVDLKDELKNTAIQITCIDRNGKEVKRVTSTSGEVEEPEETSPETSPAPPLPRRNPCQNEL